MTKPEMSGGTERLRETIADLHDRARAKAQKYIRSKTLYAEYHGIELAYETVLKLLDAESNRREAALADSPYPPPVMGEQSGSYTFVLICPLCKHQAGDGEYVSIVGCSKCNPMRLSNASAAPAPSSEDGMSLIGLARKLEYELVPLILGCPDREKFRMTIVEGMRQAALWGRAPAATEETPLVGPPLSVDEIAQAIADARLWPGAWSKMSEAERDSIRQGAEGVHKLLAARREPGPGDDKSIVSRERKSFVCKVRGVNMGANSPQDCNWPVCGCDPCADKVIDTLIESGWSGPGDRAMGGALQERITYYLALGGLWNPESMDHNGVRQLLIDCRDGLAAIERSQTQGAHHGQHSIDCDECRVFRKASAKGDNFPK